MYANASRICQFLNGNDKKFVVPVYQRPYSWKKANCQLLFQDLLTVYRKSYKSHFFGSIVFVEHEIGYNEYTIIDGQQRLTTVSLLLLAIRNYINDNNLNTDINPRKITSAYLTDEFADDEKKLKLKLVQGDDAAYDSIISGGELIENSSITVNYNYFYNEIAKLTPSELEGLYSAIQKLDIVKISLNPADGDDPQLIFESLNSTGLDLDEADKIRNYVLMNMTAKEQEKFYKQYWEVFENKVADYDANKFIRYYLATKTGELSNEKKLYFEFKAYRQASCENIEDLLSDILVYADYYKTIKESKVGQSGYRGVLARLNKLDVNTCTPLLFSLFDANRKNLISDEELEKAFIIVENYIVRRIVCGLTTNQLNKVFVSMGAEVQKYIEKDDVAYYEAFKYAVLSKTGKSRYPNNSDFKDKFVSFELYNQKQKKYFFERLENYNTKERIAVEEQIDDGTLTIEHIMPQSLTDDWVTALGSNWELIHTKYKDTIGNLTLTAYNSDYSNLPFIKKRDMQDKGFASSKLFLNSVIKTLDKWTEQTIIDRANRIYSIAEKIWWMPETDYSPKGNEEWVVWDEDYDFTKVQINKIKVMGDEISTDNVTDAFIKICEMLYELDSVSISKLNSKYFSNNSNDLRKPVEIGKNVFIETNLSSNAKVSLISSIAEHLSLESLDIQFSVKHKNTNENSFDLLNESTWDSVSVGKLAYELIKHLLENGMLSDEEIESLKEKEYSTILFSATYYPVLADERKANNSNSTKVYRYRKESVVINGRELFITTEWFEENRDDLIRWFKEHLVK